MARTFFAAAAALALAATAAPALAQSEPISTAPVQTAPSQATPTQTTAAASDAPITTSDHAVLTTSEQIDRFIRANDDQAQPGEEADGPRKIHGEVDAAVGTGGYRSAYVRADIPVGKTGTVSIAVGQGRFDDRGHWGRRSIGMAAEPAPPESP